MTKAACLDGISTAQAWARQTALSLAALPTAPACARGHVRAVAYEWGLPELADTAELLVSELVTNAVQAAQQLMAGADLPAVPFIRLRLFSDQDSMAIHVWDGSGEMPVRQDAGPDDLGRLGDDQPSGPS